MILLVGAGLLRLLVLAMLPGLGQFLDNRVEISTPVSSFKRLSECVFLYNHSIPVYDSDMCLHSPLLVALFDLVGSHKFLLNVLYTAVDVFAASQLAKMCRSRPKHSFSPEAAALVYLFNPFSLAGSVARSTNVLVNGLVVSSLAAAQLGSPAQATVLLAAASSLGLYPLYYVLPLFILANKNTFRHFRLWKLALLFAASGAFYAVLSRAASGSWQYLKIYKTLVTFGDMGAPNIGLWWYLFIELFAVFRPFFCGMFHLFLGSFALPLSIRFPDDPLFVATLTCGIVTIAKPYPEASDIGFFVSLLALNKQVLALMKFKAVVVLGLLYVSALSPTFHHLWIYVGSGNANFFYAITLVNALTLALCVCDMLWAAIRLDYDGGRATNLVQI